MVPKISRRVLPECQGSRASVPSSVERGHILGILLLLLLVDWWSCVDAGGGGGGDASATDGTLVSKV